MAAPPRVALLLGPTGSGKTEFALRIAAELPVEIVSVDSAQVYRGMDIGTAKPSAEERARVPHHLLDLRDPEEGYSAGDFRADCERAVNEILARGRVPLLVGGTMLYFRALLHGLAELPGASADLRARIDAEAARVGWPSMHARLETLDPASARRIHPHDAQRIQRALEIVMLSGVTRDALWRGTPPAPFDCAAFRFEPADRDELHRRLQSRFEAMMAAGLEDEVAALRARPALTPEHPAARAVGYRQLWTYLDGRTDRAGAIAAAVAATRQLAKRQLTWLRGPLTEPARVQHRFDPFDGSCYEQFRTAFLSWVGNS
jgi:tRNA dimethylallyltransferase